MDDSQAEIRELKQLVQELVARVLRLEQMAGLAGNAPGTRDKDPGPARLQVVPSHGEPLHSQPRRPRADLEARIGSQWLNRIGIAALLIGISYFLKYAFENNWIGPAAQILTGIFAGVALVVWSERFRIRGYQTFSYSLKAVGIGALYLSLWAAVQVYSLLSVGVAFSGMVVVTAATATFALLQNAEILAALSLAGGFATPVLLATGHNREVQLFAYLALLDAATLAMFLSRGGLACSFSALVEPRRSTSAGMRSFTRAGSSGPPLLSPRCSSPSLRSRPCSAAAARKANFRASCLRPPRSTAWPIFCKAT